MIAVDTNVLVQAHREDASHHAAAAAALARLGAGSDGWAVPWPCVHEFLAVVTHPRVYRPASSTADAVGAIEDLAGTSDVVFLGETADHLARLGSLLTASGVVGPRVHDARIAAICLGHGVDELWTADRDFSYFPALRTRNPLVS